MKDVIIPVAELERRVSLALAFYRPPTHRADLSAPYQAAEVEVHDCESFLTSKIFRVNGYTCVARALGRLAPRR